jgi:hypothetical protein
MRGISTPFVVDFTSRMEELFGAVVPMPALPEEGKVFCEKDLPEKMVSQIIRIDKRFMRFCF